MHPAIMLRCSGFMSVWSFCKDTRQHRPLPGRQGPDHVDNFAWCCPFCNLSKAQRVEQTVGQASHRLFDPRRDRWNEHMRLAPGYLFVVGVTAFLLGEWTNPGTLGPVDVGGKLVIGVFSGIQPRTAGFNSVDIAQLDPSTLLITDVLMFIGGGSAGTAGGIKVTTFALLAFVMWAEVRGEPTVHVLGRRLPPAIQRQALTVALAAVGLVMVSTVTLLEISDFGLDAVLFETVSAFATVGLSTGITDDLPTAGQLLLAALMFLGRLGPITLASALALREHERRYELPEERTIVG